MTDEQHTPDTSAAPAADAAPATGPGAPEGTSPGLEPDATTDAVTATSAAPEETPEDDGLDDCGPAEDQADDLDLDEVDVEAVAQPYSNSGKFHHTAGVLEVDQ